MNGILECLKLTTTVDILNQQRVLAVHCCDHLERSYDDQLYKETSDAWWRIISRVLKFNVWSNTPPSIIVGVWYIGYVGKQQLGTRCCDCITGWPNGNGTPFEINWYNCISQARQYIRGCAGFPGDREYWLDILTQAIPIFPGPNRKQGTRIY